MGDENKDINERVSTLEEQVKGIGEVKNKIDILYNLLMEMKLDAVGNKTIFAIKTDCTICRKEIDEEFEKWQAKWSKLYWAVGSSGFVLIVWLVEQLLHITLKIG